MDLEQLREKVNQLEIELDNVIRMSATQRLVCALKRLCESRSLDMEQFILPITKASLALKIGIEQETLSRSIPRMRDLGVIMEGKAASVYDLEKSRRTVCNDCAGRWTCKAY